MMAADPTLGVMAAAAIATAVLDVMGGVANPATPSLPRALACLLARSRREAAVGALLLVLGHLALLVLSAGSHALPKLSLEALEVVAHAELLGRASHSMMAATAMMAADPTLGVMAAAAIA